jgi:hypothetical protein
MVVIAHGKKTKATQSLKTKTAPREHVEDASIAATATTEAGAQAANS